MASDPIINAAKLSLQYQDDQWFEQDTWGVHTFKRAEEDRADLLDAFITGATAAHEVIGSPCHMIRGIYSEWGTVGFTGWHQIQTLEDNRNFGSGLPNAHQLAIVVGVRNNSETAVALGRRRNRSFVGPTRTDIVTSDSRISAEDRDDLADAWVAMSGLIAAVGSDDPVFDGLCVVSEAEGVIMEGTEVRCGQKIDTHRSRAQKVLETPANFAL
jgi:hypothetical protein